MWLGQVAESLSYTDTVRPGHGGDSKVWWFLLSKEMEQCPSVALGSRSRSLLTSVLASAVVPDPFSVAPGYLGGSLRLPVSPAPTAVSSVPPFMVESHLTSGTVTFHLLLSWWPVLSSDYPSLGSVLCVPGRRAQQLPLGCLGVAEAPSSAVTGPSHPPHRLITQRPVGPGAGCPRVPPAGSYTP